MTDTAPAVKAPRERSPSFPFIALKGAIERLIEFEKTFNRQDPPADRVYLAWGYKGDTSQAQQTLAALNAFGLVEYKGSGPKRPVAISADGRTYLRAQQDSVKAEILKRVALKPKWIGHFWRIWGADRIPDPIRLDTLVLQQKFNESAAPTFLKVYDDTIGFAGLTESGTDSVEETTLEEPEDDLPTVEVGDLVQIEINGVLALPKASRVRAIHHYEGKPWVYVEDSEAGVSMDQVRIEEKGAAPAAPAFTPPPLPLTPKDEHVARPGWKEERLVDDAGNETFLSYRGEPSLERYEFIRDYLEFRITRLKPKALP
jgi:hypothetical protein